MKFFCKRKKYFLLTYLYLRATDSWSMDGTLQSGSVETVWFDLKMKLRRKNCKKRTSGKAALSICPFGFLLGADCLAFSAVAHKSDQKADEPAGLHMYTVWQVDRAISSNALAVIRRRWTFYSILRSSECAERFLTFTNRSILAYYLNII